MESCPWSTGKNRLFWLTPRLEHLESQILKKDDEIALLKGKLASSEDAKTRFMANADLAANQLREVQLQSAAPIIEGLKPQLNDLPKIRDSVSVLSDMVSKI